MVSEDAAEELGGAVPTPAFAFLLTLIALPSLFWLVTLKRTTNYTLPEEWLMENAVPVVHEFVRTNAPLVEAAILAISALGSGWFVAIGFSLLGLMALAKRRTDLALILAVGTLAFPIEWALKYFTSIEPISGAQLVAALFNVNNIGLDDIADFPAGHALRATVLYGLAAFCVARLAPDRRQGTIAYLVAVILVGAISATRLYLGAHYPMDLLGGWMAGIALVTVIVAVHVLRVDERIRSRGSAPGQATAQRPVAVRLRPTGESPTTGAAPASGALRASPEQPRREA